MFVDISNVQRICHQLINFFEQDKGYQSKKYLGDPQYEYAGDVWPNKWRWVIIEIHVSCYRIPRNRSGETSSRILEPCFESFPWVPFVKRNGCWTKMIAKTFHVLRIKGKMEPELLQQKWDRDQTWCSPEF